MINKFLKWLFPPQQKENIITDAGPWQVDIWTTGQVVIQAHHGDEDVALIINGNFGSIDSKLEYANKFCDELNNVRNNK